MVAAVLYTLQLAAAGHDSAYSSRALRMVVEGAAVANRTIPELLRGYSGRIESELSLSIRDTGGVERHQRVEQLAGSIRWNGAGPPAVRVDRRRAAPAQSVRYNAGDFASPWVVATLYGEDIVLANAAAQERLGDSPGLRKVRIVHPLSADREQHYRFSGGDTIAIIGVDGRSLPIVRVRVHPVVESVSEGLLFDGEIYIDASRLNLVRLRGRAILPRWFKGQGADLLSTLVGWSLRVNLDVTCAEIDGQFWLPVYQRSDIVVYARSVNPDGFVARVVSRLLDLRPLTYVAGDTATVLPEQGAAASPEHPEVGWRLPLGAASRTTSLDDYDDIWPERQATARGFRVSAYPSDFDRILRGNRVEGVFTGGELSAYAGLGNGHLVVRTWAGWAWSEKVARGGIGGTISRSNRQLGVNVHRSLLSTSDFVRNPRPFNENPASANALHGMADYLDRQGATIYLIGNSRPAGDRQWILGLTAARDSPVRTNVLTTNRRGLAPPPNRWAEPGSFARLSSDLFLRTDLWTGSAGRGVGLRVHNEIAAGELRWSRSELSVIARGGRGRIGVAARVDGGAVIGRHPPPQTLFEIGGAAAGLSGYKYKEFTGDRAVATRSFVNYALPILERSRSVGGVRLPALRPGFGGGAEAGWTRLGSEEARGAAHLLTSDWESPPEVLDTRGVRGSIVGGLTIFGGGVCFCLARPYETERPWVFRLAGGLGR